MGIRGLSPAAVSPPATADPLFSNLSASPRLLVLASAFSSQALASPFSGSQPYLGRALLMRSTRKSGLQKRHKVLSGAQVRRGGSGRGHGSEARRPLGQAPGKGGQGPPTRGDLKL